jgi:hypothetical protein
VGIKWACGSKELVHGQNLRRTMGYVSTVHGDETPNLAGHAHSMDDVHKPERGAKRTSAETSEERMSVALVDGKSDGMVIFVRMDVGRNVA